MRERMGLMLSVHACTRSMQASASSQHAQDGNGRELTWLAISRPSRRDGSGYILCRSSLDSSFGPSAAARRSQSA